MKTDTFRKGRALALGLTLMTTALSTAAVAQGQGGFGGPPPGANGGGGFGGPGGGGRGGFAGGRAPFALGAISAVDANAGTVTITSQFGGGNSQMIKVGTDAQVISQADTTVANLKVGDQVQVQGVPTGITASQLTVGTPPTGLPGAGGFGGRLGGPGGGRFGGGNAGGGNGAAAQGFATATGKIASLPTATDSHLSITLGPDATLYLKMAPGAKITKYTTLKLTDLKVGDQIMATGQTGDDGMLTANAVGVNMPMMQGGFGGPNGGGFGGARAGRGRRGGGQNGAGGFGGPNGGGGFGGPPPPGPNDGNGAPPPPADGGGMMQ